MFKILAFAVITLVGMDYAPPVKRLPSTAMVVGGVSTDTPVNDFLIPVEPEYFYYTGPQTLQDNFTSYNYWFTFNADYIYFKQYNTGNGRESMIDTRDFNYSIDYYRVQIANNIDGDGAFRWNLYVIGTEGNSQTYSIAYYGYSSQLDQNGIYTFFDNIDHYVFYVHNFSFRQYVWTPSWFGWDGSQNRTVQYSGNKIPFKIDTRYHSLEKYFYFPYDPNTYGYWYKPLGTYYLDRTLGSVGSFSRPTIFNGYFKNQGNYYSKYQLDGINAEQPSNISGTNGWYFGPYNNVTSLSASNVLKPSSGSQFWIAQNGLFTTFVNTITPVWYTLYTPVTSSGTTVNVLSDSYQWYSTFYQEIYLVYEVVDTSGNLTAISDMSYYDMLAFNTGFVSNPTINTDPFSSALTLVGVAFQRVWAIGNIVLFGSITLNTLILMPILVGLVIFVIHLIKKG